MQAKKVDSGIEIVVWDTGIGIAPENIEKIFEGFFRVESPYSRVTEGTGLGLSFTKKLVELHGGTLTVESEGLNKGSTFTFSLPLACPEPERSEWFGATCPLLFDANGSLSLPPVIAASSLATPIYDSQSGLLAVTSISRIWSSPVL